MNNNRCESCKPENQTNVPLAMVELHSAAQERTIKRLWIIIIILITLFCVTNLAWLVYESQFEEVKTEETSIEAEQETSDGGNNYVIGGDMIGTTESESDSQENNNAST